MKHEWVAPDVEELVIGTILVSEKALDISSIKGEYFTVQKHRTYFDHLFKLWVDNKPLDMVTLAESFRLAGILDTMGGYDSIVALASKVISVARHDHVMMLRDLWQRREASKALNDALLQIHGGKSIIDVINIFDNKAFALVQDVKSSAHMNKEEDLTEVLHAMINPVPTDFIPTAWPSVDTLIGGLRPQELIVIAGRPGMGKTAMLVTAQLDLAQRGIGSLTFSMDMGRRQFWNRYYSQLTDIAVNEMECGRLFTPEEVEDLQLARDKMTHLPFWVDSYPYRTLADIRMITRQMAMKHDIRIVFIDHIGKILPAKSETREQEVSKIAQGLKAMSKEFDITVVAMVQLNRMVEMRADKRPMMSDLRESGAIEQEADIILMNYRPEYYGMTEFPNSGMNAVGKVEIIGAKCRNSKTGSAFLDFDGARTRISERSNAMTNAEELSLYSPQGAIF